MHDGSNQKARLKVWFAYLAAILAMYVLSVGPVAWTLRATLFGIKHYPPGPGMTLIEVIDPYATIYSPIVWIASCNPSLRAALKWYVSLF